MAGAAGAIYNLCKDFFLYVKGERQDIKDLEERIEDLTLHLRSIKSRKDVIDRSLENSIHEERTLEYGATESIITNISIRYEKFIDKYTEASGNKITSRSAEEMIIELGSLKSNILTFKFRKLARLSRDIGKLDERARKVCDRLNRETMIQKKRGPILEKLDDGGFILPVFKGYVDTVLEYLLEDRVTVVGIVGPKGVGKTTVLTKLYNRLIDGPEFEHVIKIEYPADTDKDDEIVEKMQKHIMSQLHIDHEASRTSSNQQNADVISFYLKEKKYVLLMDHMLRKVNLGDLGLKVHHQYKKVVIASRDVQEINYMSERKIQIERLRDEDALRLFESICGQLNDNKKDIAHVIIRCCGGIPWLIRRIAAYLKDKEDENSWNYIKRVLRSEPKSNAVNELDVFTQAYEIEYCQLHEFQKKCLLYAALFPIRYRIHVDYLVECWIAEGFISKNAAQKVRANRVSGQGILNLLTERHFLQWCDDKQCIMMPSDFRRVALELDYPEEEDCVTWMPSKEGMLDDEIWARVTRMSLIGCETALPESPESSNICTLLLQSLKPNLEILADSFFYHMQKLRVLDLKHTEIKTLPTSINRLVKLKSLYLSNCQNLNRLPTEAAEITTLEFLDICGTSISSLPQEISFMVDLRCLRASLYTNRFLQVGNLKLTIRQGIISKLTKLEELSIDTTFGCEQGIVVAKELAELKYLNKLCFNFPNVKSLDMFVNESKALKEKDSEWGSATFRAFKISIGDHATQHPYESDISGMLAERWLRYYCTDEEFSPACQELLNQASAFEIIGHPHVKSLNRFNIRSVKACVIGSCDKLKCIVDGYTASEEQAFVRERLPLNLEKLYLHNLKMLRCIWDGPVPSQNFSNLTAIAINCCHMLTKVLDFDLAHKLTGLEKLKVEDCREIAMLIDVAGMSNNSGSCETWEIVEVPEGDQTEVSGILKNLRTIEISNLPGLRSICSSNSISWISLNSIIVQNCTNLSDLSLTSTNAKKLKFIQGEEMWLSSLRFPRELDKISLHFPPQVRDLSGRQARSEGAPSSSGLSDFSSSSRNNIFMDHVVPLDSAEKALEEELPINDNLHAYKPNMDIQAEDNSFEDEIFVDNYVGSLEICTKNRSMVMVEES